MRTLLFTFSAALFALVLVLIGEILRSPHDNHPLLAGALQALGIGLLTSVILGAFAELALRRQMVKDFSEETQVRLREFFDLALTSSQKYGFKGLTDDFAAKSFIEQAKPGDEVFWLDTYMPGHQAWLDIVKNKAASGVKFKFLALEPDCEMAELRRVEIGGRFLENFNPELKIFISDLQRTAGEPDASNNIEIKVYSDLLANPYYLIKRNGEPIFAITSYYLRTATGVDFPHMEWRKGDVDGGFIQRLGEYFEWKWNNAKDVSDPDSDRT